MLMHLCSLILNFPIELLCETLDEYLTLQKVIIYQ